MDIDEARKLKDQIADLIEQTTLDEIAEEIAELKEMVANLFTLISQINVVSGKAIRDLEIYKDLTQDLAQKQKEIQPPVPTWIDPQRAAPKYVGKADPNIKVEMTADDYRSAAEFLNELKDRLDP